MTMKVRSILQAISGYAQADTAGMSANRPNKLAVIDPSYSSGNPKVTFEGESVLSSKTYACVGSYKPRASDRVLLVPVGTTYAIMGKISVSTGSYYEEGNFGTPNVSSALWSSFTEASTLVQGDFPSAISSGTHWVCPVTGDYEFTCWFELSNTAVTVVAVAGTSGAGFTGTLYGYDARTQASGGAGPGVHLVWKKHYTVGDTVYFNVFQTNTGATQTVSNSGWTAQRVDNTI